MTRQDRERALMIVSQAMEETGETAEFTPAQAKIDRIWGWISANGDVARYASYVAAQRANVDGLSSQAAKDYNFAELNALAVMRRMARA